EYIGLIDWCPIKWSQDACIGSQNIKSMENALEKMVASSDAPSVAAMSTIINKFAEEVKVKPESAYNKFCYHAYSIECIIFSKEMKQLHV
ncbi:hypothetical protein Tco_0263481, partial [Tanacetum coccineum]